MVYWELPELSLGWEEAAGDCGLLVVPSAGKRYAAEPTAAMQNASVMQNAVVMQDAAAVQHTAAMQSAAVMPKLRRLGPYENVGNRMPPSVGILVVLLLAAFCIWKAAGR